MVSGNVFAWNTIHHVIFTDLLDIEMKGGIDKVYEKLEKWLDDTNFVDNIGADLYINDVDEADEAVHGDGSNTPSDESYGDILVEESPEQDGIDKFSPQQLYWR